MVVGCSTPDEQAALVRENAQMQARDSKLPVLHIITGKERIKDQPKVPSTLRVFCPNRQPKSFPVAIEWRGKTSQTFPKKSYSFELRDRDDRSLSRKHSLLEMRKDDDWVLDALWNEPLSIRDFTAHQIWRALAVDHQYQHERSLPRQAFCEVFLNHNYRGVYYLGERVDRKLLNLEKRSANPGGLLFKAIDWADGSSLTSAAAPIDRTATQWSGFKAIYPKSPEPSDWKPLIDFVDFVSSADSQTFAQNVAQQLQIDNAVDYFIFINLLAAMDNRSKNYYLAKKDDSSGWYFVPWDLDLTAGICFPTERKDVIESRMYNHLFRRLMLQPEFVQAVTDRWNHLRVGLLEKENLKNFYRQNYQVLTTNGIYDHQLRDKKLRADFEPHASELRFLETWIDARVDFLDGWFGNTARLVQRLKNQQRQTSENTIR